MSRLTGSDALGLYEAYQAVYNPQELTEEQVWEEVETWVNDLIEEGYDLSDYTWEEMYEGYLEEILGMPGAQNAGAALRQGFGQARRAVGGAIGNVAKGAADVAGSSARGAMGKTTTSKNPISQAYNAVARGVTAAPRAAASFAGGVLSGKPATTQSAKPAPSSQQSAGFGRYGAPETQRGNQDNYKSTSDGKMYKNYNDALAANRSRNKKTDTPTSTPITPKPAAATPAAKPAATATAPAKPAATATAPAKPTGPAVGMLGKTSFERRTPTSAELKAAQASRAGGEKNPEKVLQAAKAASTPKPAATPATGNTLSQTTAAASKPAAFSPTPAATPAAKPPLKKPIVAGFDMFDVVKGYLIGEGYADTEEAALAIMTNMSEEWKQSIIKSI